MPAPLDEPLAGRLDLLRGGWLAGYRAVEISAVTGIPVGLVLPCAVRVLGLPERPPAENAARAAARLRAWGWFRWWRAQWWHPRKRRRRPRRG